MNFWKKLGKKALVVGITTAMVVTALPTDGGNIAGTSLFGAVSDLKRAAASEVSPEQIGKTTQNVKAVITASLVDGDYHEYYLKVNNSSDTSVADWLVAIPVQGAYGVEDWSSWSKVQSYYDSNYVYVAPNNSAVISAGGSFGSTSDGSYKFCFKTASSVGSPIVYYTEGTSSQNAFSTVIEAAQGAGSGSSGGASQTDTTTDLNLNITYNFAKLLQDSLYFYDANMCGAGVEDNCALEWRSNCHLADQKATYKGKTVDVSGGFHDAGDHVKFGLPQGYAATMLALEYYEFGAAFDELGQTAHLKVLTDYFCDYFKRCTVYNGDSVEAFCYQVGEGGSDHSYWGKPENQTTNRPAYFADASNPATDEVSLAIAALAMNYVNFKDKADLKTAEDLFAFVQKNDKKTTSQGCAGFYNSSNWEDDFCAAAAALYVATDDQKYLTAMKNNSGARNSGYALSWDNTWAISSMLTGDWDTVSGVSSYGTQNTAQGFKYIDQWGSARYNTTQQFTGLVYDYRNDSFNMKDGHYTSWATGQMKYLLGNNKAKRCFVVGYNENSSQYPHHRAASNSGDAGQQSADHYTLLGALVGGPKSTSDEYVDSQADYICNEVALDYNAGFVGAAAGLYLLHKGESEYPVTLDSAGDLKKIGIDKYYGTDGSTGESGDNPGNSGSQDGQTTEGGSQGNTNDDGQNSGNSGSQDGQTTEGGSQGNTNGDGQNSGNSGSQDGQTTEGGNQGNTNDDGKNPGNSGSQDGQTTEGGSQGNTNDDGKNPGNSGSQDGQTTEGGNQGNTNGDGQNSGNSGSQDGQTTEGGSQGNTNGDGQNSENSGSQDGQTTEGGSQGNTNDDGKNPGNSGSQDGQTTEGGSQGNTNDDGKNPGNSGSADSQNGTTNGTQQNTNQTSTAGSQSAGNNSSTGSQASTVGDTQIGQTDNGITDPIGGVGCALNTKSVLLQKGKKFRLKPSGSQIQIKSIVWKKKAGKKIVKIAPNGTLKGKKIGYTVIEVAYSNAAGEVLSMTVPVRVQKAPVLRLGKKKMTYKMKKKKKVSIVDSRDMLVYLRVVCRSSNKKIAKVSRKGVVTAKKKGKTKIKVDSYGKKYTVNIKVR